MSFHGGALASSKRGKQGSITIQHGDVVGVRSGAEPMDVVLKLDGFGFGKLASARSQNATYSQHVVCIARQAYSTVTESFFDGDNGGSIRGTPQGETLRNKEYQHSKLATSSLTPLSDFSTDSQPLGSPTAM